MHTVKLKVEGNTVWQSCSGEYFERCLDVIEEMVELKKFAFRKIAHDCSMVSKK